MLCYIVFHIYSLNIFSLNFTFLYSQLVIPLSNKRQGITAISFSDVQKDFLTRLQIYYLIVVCEIQKICGSVCSIPAWIYCCSSTSYEFALTSPLELNSPQL